MEDFFVEFTDSIMDGYSFASFDVIFLEKRYALRHYESKIAHKNWIFSKHNIM